MARRKATRSKLSSIQKQIDREKLRVRVEEKQAELARWKRKRGHAAKNVSQRRKKRSASTKRRSHSRRKRRR